VRNSENRFKPTDLQCAVWSCMWVLWGTWINSISSRQVFNRISWHEVSYGNLSTPVGFGPEGCTVTTVCLFCIYTSGNSVPGESSYIPLIHLSPCQCVHPTNKHATLRDDAETLNLFSDFMKTIIHKQNIFKTVLATEYHNSHTSARKNICTPIEKGEQHVTKPRYRRLEILFLTGKVPSQNTGA
jgi:hypothetical protein